MDPFLAFSNFQSIRLHFTNKNYDAVTYNFRVKSARRESFEKRNDRAFFFRTAKRFKKEEDLRDFFVSNVVYRNLLTGSFWIGDFQDEVAEKTYARFIRLTEGFTYTFQNDIITLRDKMLCLNSRNPDVLINTIEDGTSFPPIMNELMYGRIEIESLLIMNRVMGFLKSLNRKITNDLGENIVWSNLYNKLTKYDRLMKPLLDNDKAKTIILNTFKREINT